LVIEIINRACGIFLENTLAERIITIFCKDVSLEILDVCQPVSLVIYKSQISLLYCVAALVV